MLGRAERRTHHVVGGAIPVAIAVDRLVDDEVLDQGFAEAALPLRTGTGDGVHRVAAGGVDDVERDADDLGDAQGPIGGLAFDLGRPRQRMALGADDARVEGGLLQVRDEVAVLGMHEADPAEIADAAEALDEHAVVDHDRALVGHEVLEAGHARGDDLGHLLPDAVAPGGHRHVEGVVGGRLGGAFPPDPEGLEHALVRRGNREVDDRRGAAGRRRRGARQEVVGGDGAHEGQFHVGVRVDAAGHHVGAAGVDGRGAGGRVEILADRGDGLADHQHVGAAFILGGDHGAATDQGRI